MKENKIVYGLIGFGGMGKWHTEILENVPEIELAGIYDIKEEKRKLAEEAGLMLGDKVIAVDNGAINTDIMSVASGKLEKYIQQADGLTLEIERNGKIQMFDIAKERKPTQ